MRPIFDRSVFEDTLWRAQMNDLTPWLRVHPAEQGTSWRISSPDTVSMYSWRLKTTASGLRPSVYRLTVPGSRVCRLTSLRCQGVRNFMGEFNFRRDHSTRSP